MDVLGSVRPRRVGQEKVSSLGRAHALSSRCAFEGNALLIKMAVGARLKCRGNSVRRLGVDWV